MLRDVSTPSPQAEPPAQPAPDPAEDPLGRPLATDAEARALASTLRMRILRVCLNEPHTNKEIARRLGKDPATILHHVRRLVDTGFLEALPVRRGTRGSREIPYVATGKSWRIQTPAKDRVLVDAFIEEIALVPVDTVGTARIGFRLTDEHLDELTSRLTVLLNEYVERPDDPDGKPWSFFMALHPDPNRD